MILLLVHTGDVGTSAMIDENLVTYLALNYSYDNKRL